MFACRFNVREAIKFGRKVRRVSPSPTHYEKDNPTRWDVETSDVRSGAVDRSVFDAVVVCNGHYAVPHRADIKNIDRFEGKTMHSHDYRTPEIFQGNGNC